MWKNKKVSVVLPAYNEGDNIRKAVNQFFDTGVADEVIVVNNNSKDQTVEETKKTKAKLVNEKRQGYGWANRRGLAEASGELIITCEPDDTFVANDIFKLLAYSDDFDVVFTTRTSPECIQEGANMNWFLRLGNIAVGKLLEYLHGGPRLTDVGSTFKLIKRKQLKKIMDKFTVGKSHFSPEFMLLCARAGIPSVEIPVNYKARIGTSKITGSLWKAFKLGIIMCAMIISYRFKRID
ncbi:MAG: glycosyltransferase family 2 protein [Candidatus Woesearchaeota archaeon]